MAKKAHPYKRSAPTGKSVAVVGAGPAGLACAHRLAMKGQVEVAELGGLLADMPPARLYEEAQKLFLAGQAMEAPDAQTRREARLLTRRLIEVHHHHAFALQHLIGGQVGRYLDRHGVNPGTG